MHARGCRVCFIVPPFVLEEIARRGTPEQRGWALETLSMDTSIRAARIELTAARQGPAPQQALPSPGSARRSLYDAHNLENPTAADLVRGEGQPPVADPAVNEAYDGFGCTYGFYWDVFKRDSIDAQGLALDGVVHYGKNFDNAFWNGSRMVFGDGDGQILTRTTAAVDVIGHELTHGVTQHTANLAYSAQSGALNESISDVFGILVKQYHLQQRADQADWLIGEGIVGPVLHGRALRSMAAPGTAYQGDPQPANMQAYVRTSRDNGGVHINSAIPNHAFYLLAKALGGFAWERAGRIWYQTLLDPRLRPASQFHDFAQLTVASAQRLFGATAAEVKAVTEAWKAVGVPV